MLYTALLQLTSSASLPRYPSSYHLKGTWRIPYWQLRIPFEVDTDTQLGYQSEKSYGELEHILHIFEKKTYTVQSYGKDCTFKNYNPEKGLDSYTQYLPNSADKWEDYGDHVVLGKKAHAWILRNYEGVEDWYQIFYAHKDTNIPLRYYMHGKSIRGSHPAEYYYDIEEYSPFANTSAFTYPTTGCINIATGGPNLKELHFRQALKDDEHEFQCEEYHPPEDIKVPEEFSWRSIPGIVTVPRDQSNCGSCWAQSAAQALSSAFSLAHKGNVTASPQQIMDCVWTNESRACAGGEGYDAYGWFAKNKMKVGTEEEFPYLGVAGVCTKNVTKPLGTVRGCRKILRDAGSRSEALKRSLYAFGPHMVYMRAGFDEFVRYSDGLFHNEAVCGTIESHDQLDHGVLLTGWRKFTVDGQTKYGWEIQNSWSTMWGDAGYSYIDFDTDCGVTVYPLLPLVSTE